MDPGLWDGSEGFGFKAYFTLSTHAVENNVKISLTETQVRQLAPFFDRVQATAALGKPGMLVAQVRWSYQDQRYWMEPGFLPHEHALLISEKGQTCPPAPVPTDPAASTGPQSVRNAPGAQASIGETVP